MSIFFEDFNVLLDNKYRYDILPNNTQNAKESINAVVRFAFYLSIALVIVMKDVYFLFLFIFIAVVSYIYYVVKVDKLKNNMNIERLENNTNESKSNDNMNQNKNNIEKRVNMSIADRSIDLCKKQRETTTEDDCELIIEKDPNIVANYNSNYKQINDINDSDLMAIFKYYSALMASNNLEVVKKMQNQLDNSIDRNMFVNLYIKHLLEENNNDFEIELFDDINLKLDFTKNIDKLEDCGICETSNYFIDETKKDSFRYNLNPNECRTNCDCDGERICNDKQNGIGKCEGIARENDFCSTPYHFVDENYNLGNRTGLNYEDKGLCRNDCDCDGNRTCDNNFVNSTTSSSNKLGKCIGKSRNENIKPPEKKKNINETICRQPNYKVHQDLAITPRTGLDTNQCITDCDCDGVRHCEKGKTYDGKPKKKGMCSNESPRPQENNENNIDLDKNPFILESRKHSLINTQGIVVTNKIPLSRMKIDLVNTYRIKDLSKYNLAEAIKSFYNTYVVIDKNKIIDIFKLWLQTLKTSIDYISIPEYEVVDNEVSLIELPYINNIVNFHFNCNVDALLRKRQQYNLPKTDECNKIQFLDFDKRPTAGGRPCDYVRKGKIFMKRDCYPDRNFITDVFNVDEKIVCYDNLECVDLYNMDNIAHI